MMEADSTTIENDFESSTSHDGDRENLFVEDLSRNFAYFQEFVLPLLKLGREKEMLDWMINFSLIQQNVKCFKNLPDCKMTMILSKVVDKYQWQCQNCNQKIQIRENSFFKNIYCPLQTVMKIILAWCQDIDYEYVSNIFGLKKQIVNGIYDKIERAVSGRPLRQLGGFGGILFVELYPNFADELYPVSSKNDSSPKMQHKILCLADINEIPTRYWLHLITGTTHVQTENNNTVTKKINMNDEILDVIKKIAIPGGYCVVGGGAQLTSVLDTLRSLNIFEGITSSHNIMSQANVDMQSFILKHIWKPIIRLCEASQDLQKNKIQTYLSCALWRWQIDSSDSFLSVAHLISQQDYKTPTTNRK